MIESLRRNWLLVASIPIILAWLHMVIVLFRDILADEEVLVWLIVLITEVFVLMASVSTHIFSIGPHRIPKLLLILNYLATAYFYFWFIVAMELQRFFGGS